VWALEEGAGARGCHNGGRLWWRGARSGGGVCWDFVVGALYGGGDRLE
jgi:hypothetical protein